MKCPNCGTRMQREDCFDFESSGGYKVYKIPASLYQCDHCQAEFIWVKGVKGLRDINAATLIDVESFIKGYNLDYALLQLEKIEEGSCLDEDEEDSKESTVL